MRSFVASLTLGHASSTVTKREAPLKLVPPLERSVDFVRELKISENEITELRTQFKIVLAVLIILAAASVCGTVWLLLRGNGSPLIAVAVGVLGSATAALRSATQRYAEGWENDYGIQLPDPLPRKERFSMRMSYSFLCRPVLGATAGIAVYLGLHGGIWKVNNNDLVTFSCLLAGLFSKSLFDLLLNKFKEFFGMQGKAR